MRGGIGALIALGIIAACNSSYTDAGGSPDASTPAQAQPGEHLGACYPNGTCNKGLTCVDSVCVQLDAGAASSSSGASTSSSSGNTIDSGTGTNKCPDPVPPVEPMGVGCGFPTLCGPADVCCQANSQADWLCQPGSSCTGNLVACDTAGDCSGLCCFTTTKSNVICPSITIERSGCSLDPCGSNQVQSCNEGTLCPTGSTCKEGTIVLQGSTKVIGAKFCVPNP